jgi:hypothetical protein
MSSAWGIERAGWKAAPSLCWTEGLGAVGDFDCREGLRVGVRGCEGDVPVGVPVLGEDDVVELLGEGVDDGDYFVAVCDG